jgi:hypothetical protein
MPSAPRLPLLVALLAACADPAPSADDTADDTAGDTAADTTAADPTTSTTAAPTTTPDGDTTAAETTAGDDAETTAGGEPALTYWRDIKSILDAKCATCHRPGDIAPFAITDYEEAKLMAPAIGPAVEQRTMPPWHADPACNTYKDDRSLTDDERTSILEWISLGTPEGDPADEPPPADADDAPPIAYDIELGIPEGFTPTTLPDEYRCFLLDWPKDQDTYATAFTIEPGARPIVHHVIAFILPPDELAPFEALDAADPGPGYPCYGGPGGEASPRARWLGSWVPGGASGALPEGTGIMVEAGSKIALQMHYHPLPQPMPDQSFLRVRTATEVQYPAYLLPLANPGWMVDSPPMTIPAGDPDSVHSFTVPLDLVIQYLYDGSVPGVNEQLLVHAAGVHMHTRGVRASLNVQRISDIPDPNCLVDVPRWDFNWQGTYFLESPIAVDPNDAVKLECHHDNSAGDSAMKWGEGTEDEMCLGIMYVSAPSP